MKSTPRERADNSIRKVEVEVEFLDTIKKYTDMDKTQYRFVSIKICENMKNERIMGKNGSTIAGAHDIKK